MLGFCTVSLTLVDDILGSKRLRRNIGISKQRELGNWYLNETLIMEPEYLGVCEPCDFSTKTHLKRRFIIRG